MTNLVVKTQVKDIMKINGVGIENMSHDFMEVLDQEVQNIINKACERAKQNNRRTVMGRDI